MKCKSGPLHGQCNFYGIQTQRKENIHKYRYEKKNIYIYKNITGHYIVDLINIKISRNVKENVQTGCTGYLHSSYMNGRE